jgi:hypothetical protein
MGMTSRLRVLAIATGVAASLLAFGTNARAADEGDTATFAKVYGMQEGISPLTCSAGPIWLCSTPSTSPLTANGADCVQTVYVNVVGRSFGVPLTGCSATLSVRGEPAGDDWQGTCVGTSCAMALGHGIFTFTPVAGGPFNAVTADITGAACNTAGGHATVTANGVQGSTVFSMTGTITWKGSCSDTSTLLTWAGEVTIA